jgi:hypothetical protein
MTPPASRPTCILCGRLLYLVEIISRAVDDEPDVCSACEREIHERRQHEAEEAAFARGEYGEDGEYLWPR